MSEIFEVGNELGVSKWISFTQAQIDQFGAATNEIDPFHNDPEWCKTNSPFKQTLVYGFQTMSVISPLSEEVFQKHGIDANTSEDLLLNYGFNKLRLPAPVLQSDEIRARYTVANVEDKGFGKLLTLNVVVEIKGGKKPALIAEWVSYFQKDGAKMARV